MPLSLHNRDISVVAFVIINTDTFYCVVLIIRVTFTSKNALIGSYYGCGYDRSLIKNNYFGIVIFFLDMTFLDM